jgi:hypothetical protein
MLGPSRIKRWFCYSRSKRENWLDVLVTNRETAELVRWLIRGSIKSGLQTRHPISLKIFSEALWGFS